MKTSFKLLAVALTTAFSALALAQFAGAPFSTGTNLSAGFAAFALTMTLVIALRDYGRKLPPLPIQESTVPAAPITRRSTVYGIRRGAAAARLPA